MIEARPEGEGRREGGGMCCRGGGIGMCVGHGSGVSPSVTPFYERPPFLSQPDTHHTQPSFIATPAWQHVRSRIRSCRKITRVPSPVYPLISGLHLYATPGKMLRHSFTSNDLFIDGGRGFIILYILDNIMIYNNI